MMALASGTSRQADGMIIIILTVEEAFDVQGMPICGQPQVLRPADVTAGDLIRGDIQLRCAVV